MTARRLLAPFSYFALFSVVLIFSNAANALPILPAAPKLDTTSHILVDFESGQVLAEKNIDMRVEPASITKLMTLYVAFQELTRGDMRLEDKLSVSRKAYKSIGSRMFIEQNQLVSIRDIVIGIIVQSGNDASVALAEHIAGTEDVFAQIMNQYAQALGMTNSNFANATGLPHKDHYTTAADLIKLSTALIRDYPEYYPWFAQRSFEFNNIKQNNRNRLLWLDESVDGLKTGHTEAAGYCLVASAQRKNMRLISVVLGTKSKRSRTNTSKSLLEYGFRFFENKKILKAGQTVKMAAISEADLDETPLGLASDLSVVIPRNQAKNLSIKTALDTKLTAPLTAGQKVGTLTLTLDEKVLAEKPLVSLVAVPEGSLINRLIDKFTGLFE